MSWVDPQQLAAFGRVAAVGVELVAATVTGFFLGAWLDDALGVGFLTWAGLALGVLAGLRSFLQLVRRLRRDLDDSTDDDHAPPDPPR